MQLQLSRWMLTTVTLNHNATGLSFAQDYKDMLFKNMIEANTVTSGILQHFTFELACKTRFRFYADKGALPIRADLAEMKGSLYLIYK